MQNETGKACTLPGLSMTQVQRLIKLHASLKSILSISLAINLPLAALQQALASEVSPSNPDQSLMVIKSKAQEAAQNDKNIMSARESKQHIPGEYFIVQMANDVNTGKPNPGNTIKPRISAGVTDNKVEATKSTTAASTPSPATSSNGGQFLSASVKKSSVPNNLFIVQLKDHSDREKIDTLLKETNGTIIDTLKIGSDLSILIVQAAEGKTTETQKKLSSCKEIANVQPNQICHTSQAPNDVYYATEWDLAFMKYSQARSLHAGTFVPITMYFLDTGLHPVGYELAQNARQYDFSNPNKPTGKLERMHDSGFHGTTTSSVASSSDNILGFAGMANFEATRCFIVECRITPDGENASLVSIIYALAYLANQMAYRVYPPGPVNLSFSPSSGPSLNATPVIQSIAQYMLNQGSILILSAGNSGQLDSSPELYARRIAATDQSGNLAEFSVFGPFFRAAPGVAVPVYFPNNILTPFFADGTSYSAPRWCAAIADVYAALPANKRSCYLADQIIYNTATITSQGYHIPNLYAAIQSAQRQ